MALALYMLDVMYSWYKTQANYTQSMWTIGTVTFFLVSFVLSLLANNNVIGWIFFLSSWISLTVLKYKTTEDHYISIVKED